MAFAMHNSKNPPGGRLAGTLIARPRRRRRVERMFLAHAHVMPHVVEPNPVITRRLADAPHPPPPDARGPQTPCGSAQTEPSARRRHPFALKPAGRTHPYRRRGRILHAGGTSEIRTKFQLKALVVNDWLAL